MSRSIEELLLEWNHGKNMPLGLDIHEVSRGSNKIAWWKCIRCGSDYDMQINFKFRGVGCPYCSGYRVNHTNSLFAVNPDLAIEWHPTKNEELTPHDVTANKGKRVWWLGECGHEWDAVIQSRNDGSGCPYCDKAPKRVLVGFNDMWTTRPEQAKLLLNHRDGYAHTKSSNKKVDWICPDCKSIVKNRAINSVYMRGLICSICSDGLSFGEKVVYLLLRENNIKFLHNQAQEWSNKKRYDFYIPSLNVIIETHGIQHYKHTGRGRSLQEEQENDKNKYKMAMNNGVENYVIIDCRENDYEFIKASVIKSDIITLLNLQNVKWNSIFEDSSKSIVLKVIELWNKKDLTSEEISKITGLYKRTVQKYLIKGNALGLCEYNSKIARKKSMRHMQKEVLQLSEDGALIRIFDSASDVYDELGFNRRHIQAACRGDRGHHLAYGYTWLYK